MAPLGRFIFWIELPLCWLNQMSQALGKRHRAIFCNPTVHAEVLQHFFAESGHHDVVQGAVLETYGSSGAICQVVNVHGI